MPDDRVLLPFAALRRKLRALAAMARDPGAAPNERANAAALKRRLEEKLRDAGTPTGDWTDHAFRLGRWVKGSRKPDPAADADWTEHARHLGKLVGRAYKKWSAD